MAGREGPPSSLPGAATFGRYRLVSSLGKGGMAEVFLAKAMGAAGFEKSVVVKRILPALAESEGFVSMFIQEAKLSVMLSHANIVHVFDLGAVETEGQAPAYFMAMELVAGMDLATLLGRVRAKRERIPDAVAAFVAAEIARGLEHAHRRRDEQGVPLGIVHRDISPQNVLLSWDGEVKVTDFGIAKARDFDERSPDDTSARKLKGKAAYMSPEQARGEPVDAGSDLFSLGIVLYELLTGVLPYASRDPIETLRRAQGCELPPVEAVRGDVPRELAVILDRALRPRREDRYASATELLGALSAYVHRTGGGTPDELARILREASEGAPSPLPHEPADVTPVEVPDSSLRRSSNPGQRAQERTGSAPPSAAKFVGHKDLLAQIGAILGGVPRRERVVATLEGDEGIGKSRLVAEIQRRVARGALSVHVVSVTSPCRREARHLSTVAAIARALVGEALTDLRDPSRSLRGFGMVDDEVRAVLGLFDAQQGTPSTHALAGALTKVIRHLADERTMLLAIDDADGMDEGSARVVCEVVPRLTRSRILVLLVGRAGTSARFRALQPTELRVGPLAEDEARLVFSQLVGRSLSAHEEALAARAGNNPLFLEQLAIEHGLSPSLAAEDVPTSLSGLIERRKGRLSRVGAEALEALAVLDERGEPGALDAVIGGSSHAALEELGRLGLVTVEPGRARFVSTFLRDLVERGLPSARAKTLHLAAARALTGAAPDEVVAAHRAAAGQHGEALTIYAQAARDHLALGRYPAAAEAALSAVRACVLGEDGDVGLVSSALEILARALTHARLLRDEDNLLALAVAVVDAKGGDVDKARLDVARAYTSMSRFDEATRELRRVGALDVAGEARRALALAEIGSRSGNFLGVLDAISGIDRAELGEDELRRLALAEAQALGALGRRAEAFAALSALAEPSDEPDVSTVELLKLHGLIHFFVRDFDASARASGRGADVARILGLPYETATCLHNVGDALFRLGEHAGALATFRSAAAVARDAGAERMVWKNEAFIAYLEGFFGEPGREAVLRALVERAEQLGYLWDELDIRYLLGLHLAAHGLPSQAERELTRCMSLAQDTGNRVLVADARAALGRLASGGAREE